MRLNSCIRPRNGPLRRAVITGLGVVAPNGNDLATFWESVVLGRSAASFLTQFDTDDFASKIAAEVRGVDWARYLDAKKLKRYDKTIRFGVVAAKLAVEDSRLNLPEVEPDRKGIVEGTTVSGLETVFRTHANYLADGPSVVNPVSVINGYCGEGSSILAYELGMHAHAITYCSGCCSSNDAIGYAAQMIQLDEVDVMLAGGADANISRPLWASFNSLKVMSRNIDDPTKSMCPFDSRRDGFVLGEGAAFLVVEELAHALNRGANIYAEILGHGRSCEAFHLVDLHPEGAGAAKAMEKALRRAQIHPDEVDYINAHGTATRSNDPVETRAIKKQFGQRSRHLAVSSTKPVTGHLMGAAGAVEAVICALALHHQTIPPTINLQTPDLACDLDYVPWNARPYPVNIALNLSAGFGGKNSCLILGHHDPASV
jgi:3-oxoacyl-[acyl-carrier-protein] synthase II